MKNKKGLMLSLLGIIGLIAITAGVTYAFFNYAKEGTTDNAITTGTITFLYTEVSGVGRGISIDDAFPISDTQGKAQTGEGKVFDFKVTSTTQMDASIPYEVTARKKTGSTLDESAVKLYLTTVDGSTETEVLLDNYNNLDQTSKVNADTYTEKTIYTGRVPANESNYEQNFRLRMWIDSDVKFSPNPDGTYPYNDKTFTITVNVYANAKVVTEEDKKAEISNLTVDGVEVTKVTGKDYNYEVTLPAETTETTINVETVSEYAKVTVEKLDSLAYSSSVKRLGVSKTLELTPGDNYFRITVTNENSEVENQYTLMIKVEKTTLDSSDSLAIGTAVTAKDGSKWHVLEASAAGTETVVLLSDYNLNSDGTYNTSCQGVTGNNVSYQCSPMVFDPNNTATYDENDSNNIGYFIKNTYTPLVIATLPQTTNVTLPTAIQLASADGKTFADSITSFKSITIDSTWLKTTNYWTKTAVVSTPSNAWVLFGSYTASHLNSYSSSYSPTFFGARPVITTPKSNLLAQ